MRALRAKLYGLLAFLMASLLPACAVLAQPMRGRDLAEGYQAAAWNMACEAKRVDCTQLERPLVGYSFLPNGTLGLYPRIGGWIVIVDIQLAVSPDSVPVITHEFIHYIQQMEGSNMPGCAREKEAFDLVYELSQKYNLDPDGSIVIPWVAIAFRYGCAPF